MPSQPRKKLSPRPAAPHKPGKGAATTRSVSSRPLSALLAGALGLAALFFGLAAILAFGTLGVQGILGWGFGVAALACGIGAWFGRVRAAKLARDAAARQRTALGANALFSTLLLGLILVGINYVATRRHTAFDLTTNRVNSLSPQTRNALARLGGSIRLTYLYLPRQGTAGRPNPSALALLDAYRNASDSVRTDIINADTDPLRARALNPQTPLGRFGSDAVLVVQRENATGESPRDRQEVAVVDEANVTSALLRLINPTPRLFYVLTDHGELNPADPQTPLRALSAGLAAQNARVQPLSLLLRGARVPQDAAAVVAIAPQTDLGEGELKLLQSYLTGGGRMALLLSPTRNALPRWATLLRGCGVLLGDGLVLDPQQSYKSLGITFGSPGDGGQHPILRGTSAAVLFASAVPLVLARLAPGATKLFVTSPVAQSVIGRGAQPDAPVRNGSFAHGPYALSVASERGPSRLWITASATFATDAPDVGYAYFGNGSFALAGLNWAAGNEALVSIPPKAPVTNTLVAPPTATRFIALFSVFTLPVFILIVGGIVWWRRR